MNYQTILEQLRKYNTWYDVTDSPRASLGNDGQYALNTNNGLVYYKRNGTWEANINSFYVQKVNATSAFKDWLDNGNTGSVTDFLGTLRGTNLIGAWGGNYNSGVSYSQNSIVTDSGNIYYTLKDYISVDIQADITANNLALILDTTQIQTWKNESQTLRNDIAIIYSDTDYIKSETLNIKSETQGIRDEAEGIKNQTSQLKDDTAVLKNDTAIIKTETQAIKDSITSVQMEDVNDAITSHRNESLAISHPEIKTTIEADYVQKTRFATGITVIQKTTSMTFAELNALITTIPRLSSEYSELHIIFQNGTHNLDERLIINDFTYSVILKSQTQYTITGTGQSAVINSPTLNGVGGSMIDITNCTHVIVDSIRFLKYANVFHSTLTTYQSTVKTIYSSFGSAYKAGGYQTRCYLSNVLAFSCHYDGDTINILADAGSAVTAQNCSFNNGTYAMYGHSQCVGVSNTYTNTINANNYIIL